MFLPFHQCRLIATEAARAAYGSVTQKGYAQQSTQRGRETDHADAQV